MPIKEQILAIVKNTKYLLDYILNVVENDNSREYESMEVNSINKNLHIKNSKKNNSIYFEKALLISNKILRIYINLSRNFYGQSIILHSEFEINGNISASNLKPNPSINLSYMQNNILNKLRFMDINSSKISINYLEIIHNYLMVILLNFYDLFYFEYASNYFDGNNPNSSNTILSNNIFTSDFINDLSKIKCVITDNHFISLISSITGIEVNKENIFDVAKTLQEIFISINNYLENISDKYYQTNNQLFNEFNYNNYNSNNIYTEGNNSQNKANLKNISEFAEIQMKDENTEFNLDNNNIPNTDDDIKMENNKNEFDEKENTQRDEVTNIIDTDINTITNLNNSVNNLNTTNNNFFEINNNSNYDSIITRQKTIHLVQNILEKLNLMKRNTSLIIRLLSLNVTRNGFLFLEVINSDSLNKTIKLPNTRKIYEKCEMINKYYEFIKTQSLDYNLPIPVSLLQSQNLSQIINPLLNNQNNPGNNSPTNASTTPSNIFSNANQLNNSNNPNNININSLNNQNLITPQSLLINKLNELGYTRFQIAEFEKLLNWKKYRIYLAKLDNLLIRKDLFDLDTSLKILPEEKLLKQLNDIDFSLLVNTNFMNKRFTYVNLDGFHHFCNLLLNESLIVDKFSNISYLVNKNSLNKKLLLNDDICIYDVDDLHDVWFKNTSNFSCYKYEFEFYKIAAGKNANVNLAKIGSGIKSIGVLSLAKNNTSKSNFTIN